MAAASVQAACHAGEKNVTQSKHLFIFARRNDKKVTNDSVNVGAHGCTSLLTKIGRKNGILEDPVKTPTCKVHGPSQVEMKVPNGNLVSPRAISSVDEAQNGNRV